MIINKFSPHFTAGRSGYKPEIIVLHIIEGSQTSCDNWFANPASKVSANYSVGFNGEIHQYVKDEDTAWAQGGVLNPTFNLYKPGVNPNLYCLSIEHEGTDLSIVHEAQINATVGLIDSLARRWNIPVDRNHIIGHYQIKSSKPNCPATNKEIINTIIRRVNENVQPVDKEATKKEIIRLVNTL
jgi:N-acetyl-anhydromuramyl-L-alanine amidase AmpD